MHALKSIFRWISIWRIRHIEEIHSIFEIGSEQLHIMLIYEKTSGAYMYRVAIIDDNDMDRCLIETLSYEYFRKKEYEYEIKSFERSEHAIMELQEGGYYDVFLLDMDMPDKTGLQVAKEIRQYYNEPIIVYVTNHVEYAIQAFEVNAFRYIPKALLREKLPEAYDVLLPKIDALDQRAYIVDSIYGLEKILYRNIFYISKDGKYITIVHRNGKSRVRTSLQKIYEELASKEFIFIDKSYIANIEHVTSCQRGELFMRSGDVLPISRPRYQEVRKAIADYWRGMR